jgi:hypothetical protein
MRVAETLDWKGLIFVTDLILQNSYACYVLTALRAWSVRIVLFETQPNCCEIRNVDEEDDDDYDDEWEEEEQQQQ